MAKRKALGKGLAALLPEAPVPGGGEGRLAAIPVDRIEPSPFQPRHDVEASRIDELARSLAEQGVMQPVLVRRVGDRYQLIAGERRWRAARRAGLATVPALVRDVPDEQMLELALVENIQREELGPIEEATAYQRMVDELGLSQEQIAQKVGKDRSTIANLLRLLRLPEPIQRALAEQRLSTGHARPLLALRDEKAQVALAREIAEAGLTVREVERRVRELARASKPSAAKPKARVDPNTRAAEDRLRNALGTRVRILRRAEGGTVEIAFYSEAELHRIYEILLRGARSKTQRIG